MIHEYTQLEILEVYTKLREGSNGSQHPIAFPGLVAEQIVDISAQELCQSIGVAPLTKVGDVLFEASNKLIAGLKGKYYFVKHGNEGFVDGSKDAAIDYLNKNPGILDKEYLSLIVKELGLVSDSPIGVINAVGFDFFISVVIAHIEEAKEKLYVWDKDVSTVKELVQKEVENFNEDYKQTLLAKLDKTLNNVDDVMEQDGQIATASLYLTNFLWQVAFAAKFAVKSYFAEDKVIVLRKFQAEKDFASFNTMISVVYSELRKKHNVSESIILAAFKLFQDAAEYLDAPVSK